MEENNQQNNSSNENDDKKFKRRKRKKCYPTTCGKNCKNCKFKKQTDILNVDPFKDEEK